MRSGARRQFGISAVFFADMLFSMHKPRESKRKIEFAEGLPKTLCVDSVLFGRLPLAFFCIPLAASHRGARPSYRAIGAECDVQTAAGQVYMRARMLPYGQNLSDPIAREQMCQISRM